jgi:predicted DsbA family dithiol-disulfide isomerase
MSEAAVRLLLIAIGVAAVVATWAITKVTERWRAERGTLNLDGLDARVLFFSDAACHRCDVVRAMLESETVEWIEIGFETDAATHERVGVTGVPLLVVRGLDDVITARMAGVPSRRRLRRALTTAM